MIDVVRLGLQAVARYQTGGVQLPQTLKEIVQLLGSLQSRGVGNTIIFRPGAPTAAPYYATWSEIETEVALVDGDATLVFDNSLAPLVIPANANLDGHNLLVMEGGNDNMVGGGTIVTVMSGAKLRRIREVTGMIPQGIIHTPVFDIANGSVLTLSFGAVLKLLPGSTAPFWAITPGFFGVLRADLGGGVDNSLAPTIPIIDATAAAGFALIVTRLIQVKTAAPFNRVFLGAGATPITFIHDASANAANFASVSSGFQPISVGAPNFNDVFMDQAEGVAYDDLRVAPPYIAAGDHAFNVQLALDAIKGLLPATAFSGNVIVFDPAIPVSMGNVYKTWPEVQAAGTAAHGPLTIMFMPGCVMTAPGLNYSDNLLMIGYGGFGPNPTPITTAGGWNMSIVNLEIRDLDIVTGNLVTAPFEGGNAGCQLTLSGTTRISTTLGSSVAISLHGSPGVPDAQRIILRDQARLITPVGGAPSVLGSGGLAGGAHVEIFAYEQAVVEPNSMSIANVEPTIARQSDGASISTTQPGVPFTVEVLERNTIPFGAASMTSPTVSPLALVPGFYVGPALPTPSNVGVRIVATQTISKIRASHFGNPANAAGSNVTYALIVNGLLISLTAVMPADGPIATLVTGSEAVPFSVTLVPGDLVQIFSFQVGFVGGDPGVTDMLASTG